MVNGRSTISTLTDRMHRAHPYEGTGVICRTVGIYRKGATILLSQQSFGRVVLHGERINPI
jgi:hypothetical protein